MNTQTESHDTDRRSDAEQIATAFLRVGAAWARYGLSIARASVETSARTLDVTAGALGTLAERFKGLEQDEDERDEVVKTTGATPKHS